MNGAAYTVSRNPEEHADTWGNLHPCLFAPLESTEVIGSTLSKRTDEFFVLKKLTIPKSIIISQPDDDWIRFNFRASLEDTITLNATLGVRCTEGFQTVSVTCGDENIIAHLEPFAEYYSIGAKISHLKKMGVAQNLDWLSKNKNATYSISRSLNETLLREIAALLLGTDSVNDFNERLFALIKMMLSAISEESIVNGISNRCNRDRIVREAVRIIVESPEKKFNISKLAGLCHCSDRTLQYAFEEKLAISPLEFSKLIRLNMFRNSILNKPDVLLSTIAQQMGYVHVGNLAKSFYDFFGELPSDLRNRNSPA